MSTNRILILDLETSIKNKDVGTFQASPYYPGNDIVWTGYQIDDGPIVTANKDPVDYSFLKDIDLVVGHNIGFDLLYLLIRHSEDWYTYLKRGGKIWDTMIAEYLLTNHEHTFASLDETCVKYDGVVKDSRMKEYWKAGIDTEDIPRDEIEPYLIGDISNTKLTYVGQLKLAHEFGMLPLIKTRMKALVSLIIMSKNGMAFDVEFALAEGTRIRDVLNSFRERATTIMSSFFIPEFGIPNPTSDQQVAVVLFGGTYKYKKQGQILDPTTGLYLRKKAFEYIQEIDVDNQPILYKSGAKKGEVKLKKIEVDGELKTKLFEYTKHTEGFKLVPDKAWYLEKSNSYSISKETLQILSKDVSIPENVKEFIGIIKDISSLSKDLGTYFDGFRKLVWPGTSLIHANFNVCLTKTGRLSASKPNLQNATGKDK